MAIGEDEERVTIVVEHRELVVELRPERHEHAVRRTQILDEQRVAILPFAAVADGEHGKALVFGRADDVKALQVLRVVIHERIGVLRRPQPVEVHLMVVVLGRVSGVPFGGFGVAAVEEPVAMPRDRGDLDPLHDIGERFAGLEIEDPDLLPVGAGVADHVRDVARRMVEGEAGDARGAIRRERIGVEQHLSLPVLSSLNAVHGLVLEPVIAGKEQPGAFLLRRGRPGVVHQRRHPVAQLLAVRDAVEVLEGDGVLGGDPGSGLLGEVILEPAVGVGDRGPMVDVDVGVFPGNGICWSRHVGSVPRGAPGRGWGRPGERGASIWYGSPLPSPVRSGYVLKLPLNWGRRTACRPVAQQSQRRTFVSGRKHRSGGDATSIPAERLRFRVRVMASRTGSTPDRAAPWRGGAPDPQHL